MKRVKAVFIDRDGTLNYEKEYVYKIEDFEFIPGAIEALRLLTDRDTKIYIITNQAGIAKGYFNEEQYQELTEYMMSYLTKMGCKIEQVLYCPHHPEGTVPEYTQKCSCRKPNTKLIEEIIEQEGFNVNEIALIGDKDTDIDAGFKLGITTYLVLTGYGRKYQDDTRSDYIKPDILSAVEHLLEIR